MFREEGASGASGEGAKSTGTPESKPATEPQGEPKSINQQAKKLDWVQKALADSAELEKLKAKQAEASRKTEQDNLAAKGEFEKAIGLKDKEIEELKTQGKLKDLRAEFAVAGMTDLRAVKLFIDDYDTEKDTVADFVARIKDDEKNAMYFSHKQQRIPENGTPPGGIGSGEKFDPSWINSDDPKKREIAIERNRKAFWKKYHGG